ASTRPSGRLRTQPPSLSWWAWRTVAARKPTPCTRPSTRTDRVSRSWCSGRDFISLEQTGRVGISENGKSLPDHRTVTETGGDALAPLESSADTGPATRRSRIPIHRFRFLVATVIKT